MPDPILPSSPAPHDDRDEAARAPEPPEELWAALEFKAGAWRQPASEEEEPGAIVVYPTERQAVPNAEAWLWRAVLIGVHPRVCEERDAAVSRAERAERDRDKLIDGLVVETRWGNSPEVAWEWSYGGMGDTEPTRAEALAAIRRAAGLPVAGESEAPQ